MRWIRRHPIATAAFAVLFLFFAAVGIFADTEGDPRSEVILGLILIYLIIVAVYALVAWLYGKTFGRSKRVPSMPEGMAAPPWVPSKMPAHRPPVSPQPMFPQWDRSAPAAATCWRCGSANPPAAAFCDQCGARLATTAPVAPPTGAVQCPRCGTLLSPQVRFCTHCGLSLRTN